MRRVLSLIAVSSVSACASLVSLDTADPPIDGASSSGQTPSTSSSSGGSVTQDGVTIRPTELVLPSFKCAESATGAITLVNDSDQEQAYEATLPANDAFTIKSGATGSVKARETATITLEAKTSKPGSPVVDVAIKTKTKVSTVNVRTEVKGATLTVTPLAPDFGFVKAGQVSEPINVIFANDGNVPIEISGFDGPPEKDQFSLPATVVVPSNGSVTKPVTMGADVMGPPVSVVVTPKVDATLLCGVAVPTVTLSGQRVSDDVIVSPLSAPFGNADCNAASGTKQTVTVSNFSVTDGASFTTELPAGSRFRVAPASGDLAKGSGSGATKAVLTIDVPNAGDQFGPVEETLKVNVKSPSKEKTYDVKLTMNVLGAEITLDPTSLNDIPHDGSRSTTVRNIGNAQTCLQFKSSNNRFSVPSFPDMILPAGQSSSLQVGFYSNDSGNHSATVTMSRSSGLPCFGQPSAVICRAPPTLAVSGNR